MSACKIRVRDGFWVMLAALWCVDEDGLLPVFLFAALVHEAGHAAVLALSGGRLRRLTLTACGAVMQAALPADRYARAAVSLAGPLAGFLLTLAAHSLGAYRLAGASALLSLFNLIPLPPLDGGMALRYLTDGRFPCLRACLAAGSGRVAAPYRRAALAEWRRHLAAERRRGGVHRGGAHTKTA